MAEIFGAIAPLHHALDYHLERHNILASNVAHVDTPGYRPVDLARADNEDFAQTFNVSLQRTTAGHIRAAGEGGESRVGRTFEDLSAGAGNDGNYVSLDREAAKVAANHLRYDVLSSVISAELRQLAFAASDARG